LKSGHYTKVSIKFKPGACRETPPEVEKVVEAGKELPRKYLRLAESFKENDTNRGY